MLGLQQTALTIAVLDTLVLLNAAANFTVARHGTYAIRRKVVQYILIWLIPALGAIACILVAVAMPLGFDAADRKGSSKSLMPAERVTSVCCIVYALLIRTPRAAARFVTAFGSLHHG